MALRTADVAGVARFYAEVFGLARLREGERSVWLGAGSTVLMVEARGAGEPAVPPGTLELLAFPWAGTQAEAREHVRARGLAVEAETEFTVYFRDPDGRRVALSCFRF